MGSARALDLTVTAHHMYNSAEVRGTAMHALKDFWKNHLLTGERHAFLLAAAVLVTLLGVIATILSTLP